MASEQKYGTVPDLAAIAADPAAVSQLSVDVVEALLGKCSVVQSALIARLLTLRASGNGQTRAQGDGDRRLNVREAARKRGVSKDYLYRNASALPFTLRIGRGLGFSERGIEAYLRRRAGR